MNSTRSTPLVLSFDIGYASIGWSVAEVVDPANNLQAGVVTFPSDDVLNSERAGHRRARRNIAARRNRVQRLKLASVGAGFVTAEEIETLDRMERKSAPEWRHCPWFLAARVLGESPESTLTGLQLFHVLRWYAHNRGYAPPSWGLFDEADGEQEEDFEKVRNAEKAMHEFGADTMAQTWCALLDADPTAGRWPEPRHWAKGENMAFPRERVQAEVTRLLVAHVGKLPGVTSDFVRCLIDDWEHHPKIRSWLQGADPRTGKLRDYALPKRYEGGLLFGQHIPRFDNKIIPWCPFTLKEDTNSGKISGRNVPKKHSRAFLDFKVAMRLNDLALSELGESGGRLSAGQRMTLFKRIEGYGDVTVRQFADLVAEVCAIPKPDLTTRIPEREGSDRPFELRPERKALIAILTGGRSLPSWPLIHSIWDCFEDAEAVLRPVFHGKPTSWADLIEQAKAPDVLLERLEELFRLGKGKPSRSKKAQPPPDFEVLLRCKITITKAHGRARYCSDKLRAATDEALGGLDPRRAPTTETSDDAGCLYLNERQRDLQDRLPLSKLTNNHLVRHRLLIFRRLLQDLVNTYANGDRERIDAIVVEVARDLNEYSGKNTKQRVALFQEKQRPFNDAAEAFAQALIDDAQYTPEQAQALATYANVRRFRLMREQNFECPFTGRHLSAEDIAKDRVDFEHIIPRSLKPTDSLDAMVITYRAVNQAKRNRTAMRFIKDMAGERLDADDAGWSYHTPQQFETAVNRMRPKGRLNTAAKRSQANRCDALLVEDYEPREADFLQRDLTQTGYLMKYAVGEARKFFRSAPRQPRFIHLEGRVTTFFKKAWRLTETLAPISPLFLREYADPRTGRWQSTVRPKAELRRFTQLHHALDALTLGLATALVPGIERKELRRALSLRQAKGDDATLLRSDPKLGEALRWRTEDRFEAAPLSGKLESAVRRALAEGRVVQHVPAKRQGMKVDSNFFGFVEFDETGRLRVRQKMRSPTTRRREIKTTVKNGKNLHTLSHLSLDPKSWLGAPDHPLRRKQLEHGLRTENDLANPKLGNIRGMLPIRENWGIALITKDGSPRLDVIPYINVHQWLEVLALENGGGSPVVLRKGHLVGFDAEKCPEEYCGAWMLLGVKDGRSGTTLELIRPWMVAPRKGGTKESSAKQAIKPASGYSEKEGKASGVFLQRSADVFLKLGLRPLDHDLTGIAAF